MRFVNRRCARPGCGQTATTTLSYAYAQRVVWLDDLAPEDSPANHDLCDRHADRTQPPRGWDLKDRRASGERERTEAGVAPAPLRRLRYAG